LQSASGQIVLGAALVTPNLRAPLETLKTTPSLTKAALTKLQKEGEVKHEIEIIEKYRNSYYGQIRVRQTLFSSTKGAKGMT
jgi:hypothetical protein